MEQYQPTSLFLLDILAGLVPLSGSEFGEKNLERLIAMTRDEDYSNRDWATFLLASRGDNSVPVRDALLHAAASDDGTIRAQAIWGLARISPDLALPLVQQALAAETVPRDIFEAAALVAHSSLVEALRQWDYPSDDTYLDDAVTEAIVACETGVPYPDYRNST